MDCLTKTCSKCLENKQSIDFYRDLSKKDGLSSYCKPCRILNSQKRADLNSNEIKNQRAKYYLENKESIDKKNKENYIKQRDALGIKPKKAAENAKEIVKLYQKQYYLENKEKSKLSGKLYREKHPNAKRKYALWKLENPEQAIIHEENLKKQRLKKKLAKNAKRRAIKLQQTPKWADLKAIEEFYMNCPDNFHVDHIIPLQGKNVRGLHILENLQYLPAIENIKKGNRI